MPYDDGYRASPCLQAQLDWQLARRWMLTIGSPAVEIKRSQQFGKMISAAC
jgi:hypothetical protein